MKFKLESYNRNISKTEVRDDIRKVADQLRKATITTAEYRLNGKYSPDIARKHFGTWFNALTEAGLEKTRNINISADECIGDLKAVAKHLEKTAVTQQEYTVHGKYSPSPLLRHFGSWFKALEAAGLHHTRTWGIKNEEYFENLEEVWTALGRQPRHRDMCKPRSRYSAGAYERRFGSWRKALEAFVVFMDKAPVEDTPDDGQTPLPPVLSDQTSLTPVHKTTRNVSWRLRFLVMRRDDFSCRACGRSPAVQPGLVLHVDHVKAWTNGGETTMENLQTLCEQCNIGKSDLTMNEEKRG